LHPITVWPFAETTMDFALGICIQLRHRGTAGFSVAEPDVRRFP